MKSIGVVILFVSSSASLVAQTETFDLVSYTLLNDWQKGTTENSIGYTAVSKGNNTW
jgi:hypothetical protein